MHKEEDQVINKEIPITDNDNISEYHQLSEEFDIMSDLIQLFKPSINNSSQFLKNNELRRMKLEKVKMLEQKVTNYHQIIHLLFNNNGIDSHYQFLQLRSKLRKACLKEDIKLVDFLTRKRVFKNIF